MPHGKEFISICKRFNFSKEVYAASIESTTLLDENSGHEETKILNKVKKLMSLAQSDNEHEAKLATIKANRLLQEHNLNIHDHIDNSQETFLIRALSCKKVAGKHQAIYKILHHFFVALSFFLRPRSCVFRINWGEK